MKKTVLILMAIFLAGCGRFSAKAPEKFSGTLEMTEHLLGAKVAGLITSLRVDEGDTIQQGQTIASLERFEQTQKDHERVKQLVEKGGATQQELEYAALARDDQQIVSPVDGVILVKVHEMGEVVSAGAPVVVVGDRKDIWVRIYVPEGWINTVRMGQAADVRFDGLKETFPGVVSYISPQAEFTPRNVQTAEERVTQTFAVKVRLQQPPDYLRPGVAADVTLK